MHLGFPDIKEVECADPQRDAFKIIRWECFLPQKATTVNQKRIKNLVAEKAAAVPVGRRELLAKAVGWG